MGGVLAMGDMEIFDKVRVEVEWERKWKCDRISSGMKRKWKGVLVEGSRREIAIFVLYEYYF